MRPFSEWYLNYNVSTLFLPSVNCNRNPSFSHCRFNLLGDTNSMAQPAQIERRNKGMADSLIDGHRSPRKESSTSCFPYCSLGKRWKEAQPDAGLPTKTYCNRKWGKTVWTVVLARFSSTKPADERLQCSSPEGLPEVDIWPDLTCISWWLRSHHILCYTLSHKG